MTEDESKLNKDEIRQRKPLPIALHLPEAFFHEEERCGYVVCEKLKRIWAVELDLLSEILRICKKHEIKVQMAFGSLLGAVRHKGFIPWDDDLDVWMTRDEFDRFQVAAGKELRHPYFLQTALSDREYFLPYARLRNSETTAVISDTASPKYNNGIYVDIYILDGLPQTRFMQRIQNATRILLDLVLNVRAHGKPKTDKFHDKLVRRLKILRPFFLIVPFKVWYRLYVKVISWNSASADIFTLLSNSTYAYKSRKIRIPRKALEESSEILFEGMWMVPISKDFDAILRGPYGDYMKFPPPELRGKWHEGIIRFEPNMPYREFLEKEVQS